MSFYTEVIQLDALRFHSTIPCRDLKLLEPVTRAAVLAIRDDARGMGIDLLVTETFRSRERQELLYAHKLTQLKEVGVHHYGLAADFCKFVDGKASWQGDWGFLRDLAEKHGLISGLDWGQPNARHAFVDPDHVQRCTLEEQARLFTGEWYPDAGASASTTLSV